jgi:hypothetical protein
MTKIKQFAVKGTVYQVKPDGRFERIGRIHPQARRIQRVPVTATALQRHQAMEIATGRNSSCFE